MKTILITRTRHWAGSLTLLLSCWLLTCQPKDILPAATEEGKNTFGCKINGKSWVPDGYGSGFGRIKGIQGGILMIALNNSNAFQNGLFITTISKDGQALDLYLDDLRIGVHQLNEITSPKPNALRPRNYGFYESSQGGPVYITSNRFVGSITLTKADTLTGVVAGTFSFSASSTNGTSVNVTDGRFDVNARTQ